MEIIIKGDLAMNISPLQKARYEYSPKLPGMLRHGIADICVKEGETGMPKIFGIPLIGVIQMVLGAVIFLLIRWPFRVHR